MKAGLARELVSRGETDSNWKGKHTVLFAVRVLESWRDWRRSLGLVVEAVEGVLYLPAPQLDCLPFGLLWCNVPY